MNFLDPRFLQRRPLSPEEQMRQAEARFQSGMQETLSYGQGLENLANGFALGQKRRQYNDGRQPHEQQSSNVQKIAEALMGRQAPWQVREAPQGGGNAPAPQFSMGSMLSGLFGGRKPGGGGLY